MKAHKALRRSQSSLRYHDCEVLSFNSDSVHQGVKAGCLNPLGAVCKEGDKKMNIERVQL